jgi:hypothetical protein
MSIEQIQNKLELLLPRFDPADPRFPTSDQIFYWWTQLRAARMTNIVILNNRLIDVVQILPQYVQAQTKLYRQDVDLLNQERYVIDTTNPDEFSLEATCHLLILLSEYIYTCWGQRMRSDFKLDYAEYLPIASQLVNAIWDLRIDGGFVTRLNNKFEPIEPIEPFWLCGLAYYALFNWYALCRQINSNAGNIFNIFTILSSRHLTLLDDPKKFKHCDQHWLAVSIAARIAIGVSENFGWITIGAAMLERWENWDHQTEPLQLAKRCHAMLVLSPCALKQGTQRLHNEENLDNLLQLTTDGMIINKMSIDVEATCYVIHCLTSYIIAYSRGTARI